MPTFWVLLLQIKLQYENFRAQYIYNMYYFKEHLQKKNWLQNLCMADI